MVNVMSNQSEKVALVTNQIEQLNPKASQAELIAKVNEIVQKVNSIKVRDRGPKSTRTMTDDDAYKVKFGDLKGMSHRQAAKELGLSYGQVYSCRLGYTFNHVKDGK
jgi:hypothetical protein